MLFTWFRRNKTKDGWFDAFCQERLTVIQLEDELKRRAPLSIEDFKSIMFAFNNLKKEKEALEAQLAELGENVAV